jgi:hypothetical protein
VSGPLFSLEGQLRLVGTALLALGAVHALLPRLIGWPTDLARTTLLTRQVSYAHLGFVGLTCALLGLLPLTLARELLAGSSLARALLAAEVLFWGLRWVAQFGYFAPRLWRGDRFRTAVHYGMTALWTWVVAVFTTALWSVL